MNLNKALNIAFKSHQGQLDKAGEDYIQHPLRVSYRCNTEDQKIIAVLHDVIEDCDMSIEELRREGLSESILNALDCLTHRDEESYDDYIERVSTNKDAIVVKINDLIDNMDLSRFALHKIGLRDITRTKKYIKYLDILLSRYWEV